MVYGLNLDSGWKSPYGLKALQSLTHSHTDVENSEYTVHNIM